MLTAAICRAAATVYTRSSPAMMSDVNAPAHGANPPQLRGLKTSEKTWTAMIRAPLATPENVCPAAAPFPAAMPATCVPWIQSASAHGAAAPGPICSSRPFGQNVWLMPAAVLE
jgi:hypothetical protein